MRVLGTPTIHPMLFVAGKTLLVPPFLCLGLAAAEAWQGGLAFPALAPFAAAAVVVGVTVALAAIADLGASVRVGLPDEDTALKTHGLYRFSRNPIYTGIFLAIGGSCVLVPHWVNLVSAACAAAIHHQIVLGEERFLDARFGAEWRDYRRRVRRYF